jgi:hypothetical protein
MRIKTICFITLKNDDTIKFISFIKLLFIYIKIEKKKILDIKLKRFDN